MRGALVLQAPSVPGLRLRSAEREDAERLRAWKNAHRRYFFFQDEISAEAQRRWIEGYLARADDFMFIVELDGRPVGCMGFRLLDGLADVYNVILGDAAEGGRGLMSRALRLMLTHARTLTDRAGLKVLKDNPAVGYYQKNGFHVVKDAGDHLEMTLDWSRFEPLEVP